ncbi:MAG TPA: CoA transferase subunit A [Clostridiales bacterium]|nr:CoA transferase subunit A [Clostridiales bacterium]
MEEAISFINPGDRIMVGSFGLRGCPDNLIDALAKSGIDNLTIISNDFGSPGIGLGKLLRNHQVSHLIGNYYNWNPEVADAANSGEITVRLVPQGTFAEAIRAAGAGIPAFYTPTAVGTELAKGKETKFFNGREYLLEEAIHADVALIYAHQADSFGNLMYYRTARNFNPLMATAAKLTIVECEQIIDGYFDPEFIMTPHIYVDILCCKEGK